MGIKEHAFPASGHSYPAGLLASKGFLGFKSEPAHEIRVPETVPNEMSGKLMEAWDKTRERFAETGGDSFLSAYYLTLLSLHELDIRKGYRPYDIQAFIASCQGLEGDWKVWNSRNSVHNSLPDAFGAFISALVNDVEADYALHLADSGIKANRLGYKNKGNLLLIGDVGEELGANMAGGRIHVVGSAGMMAGRSMESGEIFIEGDAGANAGSDMTGGRIIISGNAQDYFGRSMKGGAIRLTGNASQGVGFQSSGGEIHIEGELHSTGPWCGADVYHKGSKIEAVRGFG